MLKGYRSASSWDDLRDRGKQWLRVAPVTLALTLAACSGDAINPVGDPGGGSLDLLNLRVEDLAPTCGVVRFQTSRPTSCRAQFGLDPDVLDHTATDPSMVDGQRSSDHEVPLEDLEPGSTYAWRAAATDAESRTYTSDLGTFRTPPSLGSGGLVNIVLVTAGKTVAGRVAIGPAEPMTARSAR